MIEASVEAGFDAYPHLSDLRNAKRAGTEARPYEWPSEKRKAYAPSKGQNSFGFPVREGVAVRPYAEDLSIDANSAIVGWRFKYRKRLCRGRLPRLPTVTDIGNASTNLQHQTSNPFPREGVAGLPYAEYFVHQVSASSGARWPPEAGSTSAQSPPTVETIEFSWAPWWRPEADTA